TEHASSVMIRGEADQFFHVLKRWFQGQSGAKIDEGVRQQHQCEATRSAACNTLIYYSGEEAGAYREGRGRY
ncbi:MAG: hypothetical protein ACLR1V_09670, partial [Coprococcus sp.]